MSRYPSVQSPAAVLEELAAVTKAAAQAAAEEKAEREAAEAAEAAAMELDDSGLEEEESD